MDDAAASTLVEWRVWGAAAFESAAAADKPILLALTTPWCGECREMDRTTYSEPRIAAACNEGFVPVRVDADRHPMVRDRYTMGGFPSTVFTTPAGEVISGATFLGEAGFRGILKAVREAWAERGEAAGSVPRALREATPPGGRLRSDAETHLVEQLLAAYDEEFGGWGTGVKFPRPRTIEFALVRARAQATRTLEAVRTHLFDTYDGGFYRFATERNWRGARREKLTDENAALLRAFAYAYRYTGEEAYREPATTTLDYLTTVCWTGAAFAASQGGDEGYFRLAPAAREDAEPPPVDDTVFADRNGLAIDACCWLYAYTGDDGAARYAARAREHVCETLVEPSGRVAHFEQRPDRPEPPVGLLLDQARLLQGLSGSWQVLGTGGPALAIADWTLAHRQGGEAGAFTDGPTTGPGLTARPLWPLEANAAAATALHEVGLLSGQDRYRDAAQRSIAAFGDAVDHLGVDAAEYATAVARVRDPAAVAVGTPAGSDLHRAALRLADHETVVVPMAHRPPAGRVAAAGGGPERVSDDPDGSPLADPREAVHIENGETVGRAGSPRTLETLLTDT